MSSACCCSSGCSFRRWRPRKAGPLGLARGSAIVGIIDAAAPEQPAQFAAWGRSISDAPYPSVLSPLEEPPDPGPPPQGALPADVDARVRESIVLVEGHACGQIQEGVVSSTRPPVSSSPTRTSSRARTRRWSRTRTATPTTRSWSRSIRCATSRCCASTASTRRHWSWDPPTRATSARCTATRAVARCAPHPRASARASPRPAPTSTAPARATVMCSSSRRRSHRAIGRRARQRRREAHRRRVRHRSGPPQHELRHRRQRGPCTRRRIRTQ